MKYSLFIISTLLLFLYSCSSAYRYDRSLNNNKVDVLNIVSRKWLDTPYQYGGISRNGIDCSGLAQKIYLEVYHHKLPRTSQEMYKQGTLVRFSWIKPGDLVFFRKNRGSSLDHVGVYLGNQQFIHATNQRGVIISELNSSYYKSRIVGIRRYLQ